jgi:hypothetical protein
MKMNEGEATGQQQQNKTSKTEQRTPASRNVLTSKEGWTFHTRSGRCVRIIARGHCPARRFPPRSPNVFKVATIREPVERFISAYNFVREGGINHPDQGAVQQARDWSPFLQKFGSIDAFVNDKAALKTIMSPRTGHTHFDHLMPWVCAPNGEVDVDLVIRQGHVSADFRAMCDILDIHLSTPSVSKRNVTGSRSKVSDATTQALKRLLREDIQLYTKLEKDAGKMQEVFRERVHRLVHSR